MYSSWLIWSETNVRILGTILSAACKNLANTNFPECDPPEGRRGMISATENGGGTSEVEDDLELSEQTEI